MIHYLRQANSKNLRGTALVRLDFNTEDDWRLQTAVPTIRFLLSRASKIVIISHKGRPTGVKILNGVPVGFDKKLSLRKSAHDLEKLLHRKVLFIPHFRFTEIKKNIAAAPERSIFVLENTRFLKGEESNSGLLAARLASLADFYVNDAFAVSHRANASVAAITGFLPSFVGFELEKEVNFLSSVLARPKKPLVFVLGGSKAADKLGIIKYFKNKADYFLLGGAAANTILFLKGVNIKRSLRDRDAHSLNDVRPILKYKNVVLPTDCIWYSDTILDIGQKTIQNFTDVIAKARTIVWSGPLGRIEKKPYDRGTRAVATAAVKNSKAFLLTGGGETVTFLKKHGLDRKFSFISTGGTAMLDFLAGKKLPGIAALQRGRASPRRGGRR